MYQPEEKILRKYADVLVNFALNSGKGVKAGEVVQCVVPDIAKPLLKQLHRTLLQAGAHPLIRMLPTEFDRQFYELADNKQLTFFPEDYIRARVDLIDHSIGIIAEHDLFELQGVEPKKITQAAEARKKYRKWLNEKEYAGKFTWTLALYGAPAMAEETGMKLEDYWSQIIKACFLDKKDPIGKWREIHKEQERIKKSLDALKIDSIHIESEQIDLWLTLGKRRKWMGGSGRNIPSFEIFTSPDWRGTEGYIEFNQPLYRYGNKITGIRLEFKQGRVVSAKAAKREELLREIIARPDADKVGEFSLTDSRLTRIDRFMATTLYDENIGAKRGNTHIALGMAYKDAYDGKPQELSEEDWEELGFNYSGEHCDMISTEERQVTAVLQDGSKKVIYNNGRFVV